MPAIGLLACTATGLIRSAIAAFRGMRLAPTVMEGTQHLHGVQRTAAQVSGNVHAAARTKVCVATDTDMAELVVAGGGAPPTGRLTRARQIQRKRGARVQSALDGQIAAHRPRQVAADRKA